MPIAIAAALALAAAPTPTWCSVAPSDPAPLIRRLHWQLDSAPHPLVHVHTEHTLAGDPQREASLIAERQLPLMRQAALAWRAGAGEAYFDMAQRYLMAWMGTYQPDLNPIDETGFDALVDTYALIEDHMRPDAREAARAYLVAWGQAYVRSIDEAQAAGKAGGGTWTNNWQSHRIKLVTMMAVASRDPALFAQARTLFDVQLAANLRPGGQVLDFTLRDALHYVVYDLEPLLQAALAARAEGEDWYHRQDPAGASLAGAVAWLRPYAAGEKPHQEFVHSTVPFDAERAQHGEKGYSGPFDPKTAGRTLWLAAQFDPTYRPLAAQLEPQPADFLAFCGE